MTELAKLTELRLADVGEGMHEAEILRWLVSPGEVVKVDQTIVEIQTDKAVVELPAPVTGKVAQILAPVGTIAHVGDLLITFQPAAVSPQPELAVQSREQVSRVRSQKAELEIQKSLSPQSSVLSPQKMVRAAPAVRKKALELGIDLRLVKGSSPEGRILMNDVLNFSTQEAGGRRQESELEIQSQGTEVSGQGTGEGFVGERSVARFTALTPASEERKPLVGLRRRIAERMELSWRTIPQVTTFSEVDGVALVALRASLKPTAEKRGTNLTYLPFIVKAVVATLKQFPLFNASFDQASREVVLKHYYHIGVAAATADGLLVPVLHEANKKTLFEIASELNRLSEGARTRKLAANELSGSTFTITNVGSFGGDVGTAIINPPEAAILGVGRLQEKAVVRDGRLAVRAILPLSLTFDHRLIDGADAGAFTNALKQLLENPNLLMLDMS